MSKRKKKKKKGKKKTLEVILLATAVIDLAGHLIELLDKIYHLH